MAIQGIHLGGHAPAAPAPACSAPPATTFLPPSEQQLDQVLEHAELVRELGVGGAPGAAYQIAEHAPNLVLELRLLRAAGRAPGELAISEQLWRERARKAEKQAVEIGAAGEDLLRELANERGTKEGLEAKLTETKADLERVTAENERRRFEAAELRNQRDGVQKRLVALEQLLLDATPGSSGPAEARVAMLQGRVAELEAACRATLERSEALIAELRGSAS